MRRRCQMGQLYFGGKFGKLLQMKCPANGIFKEFLKGKGGTDPLRQRSRSSRRQLQTHRFPAAALLQFLTDILQQIGGIFILC